MLLCACCAEAGKDNHQAGTGGKSKRRNTKSVHLSTHPPHQKQNGFQLQLIEKRNLPKALFTDPQFLGLNRNLRFRLPGGFAFQKVQTYRETKLWVKLNKWFAEAPIRRSGQCKERGCQEYRGEDAGFQRLRFTKCSKSGLYSLRVSEIDYEDMWHVCHFLQNVAKVVFVFAW